MEQPEWSLKTINQHPFPQHQQRSMWSAPTPLQFLPSLFCYHLLNPATFASFLSFVNPIMSHLWAFPLAVHLLFPLPGLLSLQLQLWLSLLHPSSHRQSTPWWPSLLTWANLAILHYFISLITIWSYLVDSLFSFLLKIFFFFGLFYNKTKCSRTGQGLCLSYLALFLWSQEQSLAQSKCSRSVCGMNEWMNEGMSRGDLKNPGVRPEIRVARFCKYKFRAHSYTWISDNHGMYAILYLYMSQILPAFLVYLKFKCNWVSCIISGSPRPDPLRSLCELNRAKKTFSNLCLLDLYELE